MNSLLSRKSCNLWCYSFWQSTTSIVSINLKAQRNYPTLRLKQEIAASHGNPTQGVHIIIAFIDKTTAKFFISSFNTRSNQPVDYHAVERRVTLHVVEVKGYDIQFRVKQLQK